MSNPVRDWIQQYTDLNEDTDTTGCLVPLGTLNEWASAIQALRAQSRLAERKIVAAAVRIGGVTISLMPPARHSDILRELKESGADRLWVRTNQEFGFLDNHGRFWCRRRAARIAIAAGQVKRMEQLRAGQLYSEDLW